MLKGCIVGAALFLTLPLFVSAESFGNNLDLGSTLFSIGPRATYFNPHDANKGKWSGGVQARMRLIPGLKLEGSIDYRRNEFESDTVLYTYPVQASLLAYLMPRARWSPFLLGGTGWYYSRVNGPADFSHTDSRFGLHAGGGLEVMLNEYLSLDGTYRYVWLESVASKDVNAVDKSYRDSGSMVTIALNYLFSFSEKNTQDQPEPKAALKAEPVADPNIAVLEKLIILDENTHFKFDKATLTKEGARVVKQNAQVLRDNPKTKSR